MNAQMAAFLDVLHDAVVMVDASGIVRHHNAQAAALLKTLPGQPFPNPWVRKAVADVAAGYATRKVALGEGQARTADIIPLQGGLLFALVIHQESESQFYQMTTRNLYELLRGDLAQPIQRFMRDVTGLDGDQHAALLAAGRQIAAQLERIVVLADLFGSAPLRDRERLAIEHLLAEALTAEAPTLVARRIQVFVQNAGQELPPVYGSRPWLVRALRELINNAGRHAVAGSRLEITLRCTGAHVILSMRNHGQSGAIHLRGKRPFVPFNPGGRVSAPHQVSGKQAGMGIGLPICQQIMHLHGGHLSISEAEEDGLIEFNLELATGAPSTSSEILDVEQAQRYAHDMAALRQRLRQRGAAVAVAGSMQ